MHSLSLLSLLLAVLFLVFFKALYNTFLHPLRSFPGPWYCGTSRLWYCLRIARGDLNYQLTRLHNEFGSVVRIAPNELSYSSSEAWDVIYGKHMKKENNLDVATMFHKDPVLYGANLGDEQTLINAEGDIYKKQKRVMVSTFSNKAILAREDSTQSYITSTIAGINEHIQKGDNAVDIKAWFENTTFDLACNFTVNRDMQAIKHGNTRHPVVKIVFRSIAVVEIVAQFMRLPSVLVRAFSLLPQAFAGTLLERVNFFRPIVLERLEEGGDQPDIMSYLLSVYPYDKNDKTNLIELINNATLWIIVGFFTESSFLAGAIYNLLTNPSTLLRLRSELQENFQSKEDITMAGVQKLDYLSAVVNESFRTRPPAPLSLTRIVPKGGAVICGKFVPEDTVVGIPHWAAYRHSENFRYADQFLPERWLQDAKSDFANDDRDVVHAFSHGPRACIAKGYASIIIRLLLARFIWEFDMKLDPRSNEWGEEKNQKGYFHFHQGPLLVQMERRTEAKKDV